jgi:hypothetical protein
VEGGGGGRDEAVKILERNFAVEGREEWEEREGACSRRP